MTIVKRTGLGRAMTWSELDGNWDQLQESTAAAQQSAALASASQSAAATSESNAAESAAEASSQASAAGTLRTDLASTDDGKGLSLSVAEDGTTGQQFYDSADQFAGDYGTALITISSVNRWITYNGERWYVKPGVTVPFTTTGLNATSWAVDSANFNPSAIDSTLRSDLTTSGVMSIIISEDENTVDNRDNVAISYGSEGSRTINIDPSGVLKTGAKDENGIKTADGITMPFVSNTGNIIKTGIGTFAEKQLWLPSDGFEDSFASPSFGITYDSTGKPSVAIIIPAQTLSGSASWPDQTREGRTFWNFLLADDIVGKYIPHPSSLGQNSSARYIQIAKWKVASTPWNTELKLSITSSNTSDNFLGTVTLEANLQSSGNSFATTSNLTQVNLSKYIKVKFDGPRDRLPLASATSANVPAFGCTTDGTYLYLYAYIPAGQSSPKLTQIAIGTGSALTVDYTGTTTVTEAPSGFIFVPMWSDTNGLNTSVANDGSVVASDNHVRICSTSGGNTTRPDIAYDGFLWGGYGTYKNGRQSCSITHSSTGVYVVTGPHSSTGWQLRQPVDQNGEQVAIARVTSTSSDGLTNTISVYAIKYTYDSTAGTVTRGIGDLMDIPSTSWVDMHASTTF